jgi:hypothetical protein
MELEQGDMEELLRRVLREELASYGTQAGPVRRTPKKRA